MSRTRPDAVAWAVILMLGSTAAEAQEAAAASTAAGGRSWSLTPYAGVTETITDNLRLSESARRKEAVTALSVGVRLGSRAGRVRGELDYSVNEYLYARGSESSKHQNNLSANGQAELVDGHVYLDASASIGQQSISAFGTQSTDGALVNANRTEVRTYRLSPYARGLLSDIATYEARLGYSASSSSGTTAGDSTNSSASLSLASASSGSILGWNATLSHTRSSYSAGTDSYDSLATAGLVLTVMPELRFTASAGRERSDAVGSVSDQSSDFWSLRADITPTERTKLSLQRGHRYFGDTYLVSAEHRFRRSLWRFSSSDDLTGSTATGTGYTTAYDLLYAQLAATVPDPATRAALVTATLNSSGISPTSVVATSFLTNALTRVRRTELSTSIQGPRSTLTLTAFGSESRRVDAAATTGDDLDSAAQIRQAGANVSWSHRLTPLSALTLTGNWQRNTGSTQSQHTTLRSLLLSWSATLSPRLSGSLSARHVSFGSTTGPYRENAAIGSLSLQF